MTPIDDMAISCKSHCICPPGTKRKCTQRRQVPGSNAFVPSVVGLIIAGEVVKDLIKSEYSVKTDIASIPVLCSICFFISDTLIVFAKAVLFIECSDFL